MKLIFGSLRVFFRDFAATVITVVIRKILLLLIPVTITTDKKKYTNKTDNK